jgi:hypothetical protein
MDAEELKKYRRRLVNRLYYLKKMRGDIRNFSKNYKEDAILLDFLKVQEEYKKCVEDKKIFSKIKNHVYGEKDKMDVCFQVDF